MDTTRTAIAAFSLLMVGLSACGGSDDDTAAPTSHAPTTAAVTTAAKPDPTPATTRSPVAPPVTAATTTAPDVGSSELAAQIEALLIDAIRPGSIRWDANGVDSPPTAAVAAVRIPGREDLLVAVGHNVDGSPTVADAPFPVATLTESLVRTVAFQLVDEGVLDPSSHVGQWVPTLPNADRVTVQMVLDNETGWSDYGQVVPDPILTDLDRAWSLREAVESRAPVMTALGEPGSRTNDGSTNEMVLGLVVEEVSGRPLAELVRDKVTVPTGLDDTALLDGRTAPPGYRHGVFGFNGTPAKTSGFGGVSFVTWNQATHSVVSTPTDLLDLLDAWATGELFTTERTSAPARYAPDPAGNPNTYAGLGVPFNGYCPCTEVEGGIEPTAIGRVPGGLGTKAFVLRYADGISVVVNVNSNDADQADLEPVASAVHDLAAAAR